MEHSSHSHTHSTTPYYIVYALLMLGLVATVWVAYMDMGMWANPVAMAIATTKAILVIWIFMHVKDSTPMIWITIGGGIVGLLIGFIFLFCDYFAR